MVVKKRPSSTQPLESSPPSPAEPLNIPDVLVLPIRTFEIPASLLLKLNRYTQDRDLSERLVKQVTEKNHSQDGKWYAEKALWDLERNRK